jgi:hypothetical protein
MQQRRVNSRLGTAEGVALGLLDEFNAAALGTDDGELLGLDDEGLEMGSDDGDSIAIFDGPQEPVGVGASFGLELGLLLDGMELGTAEGGALGVLDGFNAAALGTDDGELLGLNDEGLELESDDGDCCCLACWCSCCCCCCCCFLLLLLVGEVVNQQQWRTKFACWTAAAEGRTGNGTNNQKLTVAGALLVAVAADERVNNR